MRQRAAALAVLVALMAPAACSDDRLEPGEARLEVDGVALVERQNGDRDTVRDSTDLRSGDRVSMTEGAALMRLAGGTVFELRAGFDEAADTALLMGERPELEAGELLVSTPEAVDLEADGTEVRVADGAARLTRAFGMSVAAYDADVALDSAGVTAEVPALRQMVVPDLGRPPRTARPIAYEERDTWDRRHLGAAMAVGERLETFADGVTARLPEGEGRTPGFFRLVLPGLEDEQAFDTELLAGRLDRPPGDNLVGAAIADLGERDDFADRWAAVFDFRDEGAEWGIVALDQAVRSQPLVGSVEDAFNASFAESTIALPPPESEASAPDPPVAPGSGAATVGRGPSGGTAPTPTTTPTAPPPGSPSPTTPPTAPPSVPPAPPPPPLEPTVDPVTELVDDVIGGLLGGLLGG